MSLQNKRRGLGRGLDAILQSPETDITSTDISGNYVAGAVAELNLDFIEANPFQPCTFIDSASSLRAFSSKSVLGWNGFASMKSILSSATAPAT